jgi:hypothetical protein
MATKELDPGQQHTFALAPLRIQLTGAFGAGVVLRAEDQAGAESTVGSMRLTEAEMVLTPQPRRVRMVASPAAGSFAAGTTVGLMVRTEGANVVADQVMVAPIDVGALEKREIAVIEFAEGRAVLSVIATPGAGGPSTPPPASTQPAETFASAQTSPSPTHPVVPPPVAPMHPTRTHELQGDDAALPWLQPGRYAFRDAGKVGGAASGPEAPPASWGLVLDASASMRSSRGLASLLDLVTLVSGVAVEWTHTWPAATVAAGVQVVNDPTALRDPRALLRTAYDGTEPSSWSTLAAATEQVLASVGHQGCVLIVTDGVPGDVDDLEVVARRYPGARIAVVTTGRSVFALPSDGGGDWWAEELAGLGGLAALPNVRIAAVKRNGDGSLELGDLRAAELALALTGPQRAGVPA